jgi:CheY-like chemotaxis protein
VESVFERAKDLREKVETAMLKKIEWRILFSVDGKRTVADIAEKVERDENFVEQVLQKLTAQKLLTGGGASKGKDGGTEVKKPKKEAKAKKEKEKEQEPVKQFKETPKEKPPEPKPVPVVKKEEPKEEPKEEFDLGAMMTEAPKVEAKPVATPKPVVTTTGTPGGKKILIVDDSIVIQKMVEIALENEHFQLSSAMKGEDGIKAAKEFQPSLILLDMMLPDMNGLDVMKGIRELGGAFTDMPIVMLSGKDSPQDKDTAINSGATDFLTKPFHDEDLISKVHEYLGK